MTFTALQFTVHSWMTKTRSCPAHFPMKITPLPVCIDERCLRMHIEYEIRDHRNARTQVITLNITIHKDKPHCSVYIPCYHNNAPLLYCFLPNKSITPHLYTYTYMLWYVHAWIWVTWELNFSSNCKVYRKGSLPHSKAS